jgi:hypothetical protein
MLQSESFHFDSTDGFSVREGEYPQSRAGNRSRFILDSTNNRTALLESLMPDGVSPAKRAVIERLVTLWLAESRLDVA